MSQATCISEASYSRALTRGKRYEILALDEDNSKVRVRGDNGRIRWFPKFCFDLKGRNVAVLVSFTVEDPIRDPLQDCVEVTIKLSNHRRRWCFFVTPRWLSAYLDGGIEPKAINHNGMMFYQITVLGRSVQTTDGARFVAIHVPHMIIVPEIAYNLIESTIRYFDSQGELTACTRPLK